MKSMFNDELDSEIRDRLRRELFSRLKGSMDTQLNKYLHNRDLDFVATLLIGLADSEGRLTIDFSRMQRADYSGLYGDVNTALSILAQSGLIISDPEGDALCYRISPEHLAIRHF